LDLAAIQSRLLELKRQNALDFARSSFVNFVLWVDHGYHMKWYHRLLAEKLNAVASGKLKRLIVNMPPRHGKSQLVSRLFPAYLLGINPNMRVLSASYNAELASSMNRDVQRIIDGPLYQDVFPKTTLSTHNARSVSGKALRNSDCFEVVNAHGFYRSAGVGGAITGIGADVLLVDDPVRSEDDARSVTIRQKTWEWWTNTFLTRQQSGAAVIVCMTRWHTDDLVGRILQRAAEDSKADQWEIICFPAIREDDNNADDPRQIGESLWPELYGLEYLERMRASMGDMGFAGLYQQRPSIAGGSIFKENRWCFWYRAPQEPPPVLARDPDGALVACQQERLPEKFERQIQTWDMAFKDTKSSDFVVGQVLAKQAARTYLLDQVRGRMDFPRTVESLREFTHKWPKARAKLIEDKANGPAVIAAAKREIPGLIAINPEGGKEARAHAVAPLQEGQNLYLPHPSEAPWVRAFLQEFASFPKAKHDDQVDAFTQGINWLYGRKSFNKVSMVESNW
jgi:predicted phage terminase large subunit-like protein